MKKIEGFIGCYSTSKTLRFKAIPVAETQENITAKRIIEEDEERAKEYLLVKQYMDKIHKEFIERVLNEAQLEGLEDYINLFCKKNKSEDEKVELESKEVSLRKQIANLFENDEQFSDILSEKMLKNLLPEKLTDPIEKEIVSHFDGFYTAFKGFEDNRRNVYSSEAIATAVSFRLINENLPKFIANLSVYQKMKAVIDESLLKSVENEMKLNDYSLDDIFNESAYIFFLSQHGITLYNSIVGGYTNENGIKIQGLNEYINLYNQQVKEKNERLPLFTQLFKQILSDVEGVSYYQEGFNNDEEFLNSIEQYVFNEECPLTTLLDKVKEIFNSDFDESGIFVLNGPAISNISNGVWGSWSTISDAWNKQYDAINMKKPPKDLEAYETKRKNTFKAKKSFALAELSDLAGNIDSLKRIWDYYSEQIHRISDTIEASLPNLQRIISTQKSKEKKLLKKEAETEHIKNVFDGIKELENLLKPLRGTQKEENRDARFYGLYEDCMSAILSVDNLYDKIRNYITQKAYSTDKFKLYFQNPQLLGGWDRNKERDYRTALLRKDGKYYLAIIDKCDSKALQNINASKEESFYEKMSYKLLPSPSKMLPKVFFSKKGKETFAPAKDILDIYDKKTFLKGTNFKQEDCWKMIDFYQDAIKRHEEWSSSFNFRFRKATDYQDISEFYHDVEIQGYNLGFEKVSQNKVDELVKTGKVYLFQLYNKDFSEHSRGTKNLHTMYFEALFDTENLKNGSFKLNGEAELFMRRASIKPENRVIHPANHSIKNKNPLNPKKESVFPYDLIKDKRYSVDQYEFHVPITINRCPENKVRINEEVRKLLAKDENPFIIGIDRGERNLLYVCVIDGQGNIVEQFSLNEIINEHNGITYRTDYHELLERKEKERTEARINWKNINNIKDLKEGYISQVVHKICELVIKYDAVIAMEDLNSGFKNSRAKVEKQVYQKFEKALIDKLNYLAEKDADVYSKGGILKGYQLANPFVSFKTMGTQNGFIFYIPAWLTSKIDPTTGFVNLLNPKYTSVEASREFLNQFDKISYNSNMKYFEFELNYASFAKGSTSYQKNWTLCTKGTRIRNFRNPAKNSEWDWEEVDLTEMMIRLLKDYNIDYMKGDLKDAITAISEKDFYLRAISIISLMLQMRNSISGRTDIDYLISPVKNARGYFYDSRTSDERLPCDADANGAYNIARKVLWAIEQFKEAEPDKLIKTSIAISNKNWLEYAQTHTIC